MTFTNRPQNEQKIIAQTYDFEIKAIDECDGSRNPWFDEIMTWADGSVVWEAINEAVSMLYSL